ncbi:MAG: hypothetical protein QM723_21665 [Myxococcaceae bacterium]
MNPSPDRRGPTDAQRPRGEVRALLFLIFVCAACVTGRQTPDESAAQVTALELQFDEGKGDLRFNLYAPGFNDETEIHWQLQIDHRPLAAGVAMEKPNDGQLVVITPVHLKGVRFDDGARRVHLLLTGDAVAQGAVLATPRQFSLEKEVVLVGAPMP